MYITNPKYAKFYSRNNAIRQSTMTAVSIFFGGCVYVEEKGVLLIQNYYCKIYLSANSCLITRYNYEIASNACNSDHHHKTLLALVLEIQMCNVKRFFNLQYLKLVIKKKRIVIY